MTSSAYSVNSEVLRFITDTPKTALYVFLVTLFSTYYLILKCRRDPRLVEFSKAIPGPAGLPLIGNSLPFVFNGLKDFNKVLSHYSKKYGSVYKLWLGNELVIGLSNIDHLKEVFRSTKALSKPKVIFHGYKEQFGNSLFTTSIPIWRQTRKRIQPTLWKNAMKSQLPSIQEHVDEFMNVLENHVNGDEFNVKHHLQNLSIDVFSDLFYNVRMTSTEKENFKFYEIFEFAATYAISKAIFPWLRLNGLSKLYFRNRKEKQDNQLREFYNKLKNEQTEAVDTRDDKATTRKSFLSVLQDLEKDMKVEDYAFDEAKNFMVVVAGSVTKALSFLLLAIAMHSDIQEKLIDEINSILGDADTDEPVNVDDFSKFVYLDQVYQESQRRFTLIRDIFREVEEDMEIGSMIIPAKATIMIRIGDVHMNPDLYPNPEQFNPENFSAEAVQKRSKYSFLAFSQGIRDCIGKYFADYVTKLFNDQPM